MPTRTTRLSSKGQVVIPAWVRGRLALSTGEELSLEIGPPGERSVTLRAASGPEIERLLEKGYRWLEQSGDDPLKALHEDRRRARAHERRTRRR